MASIKDQAIGAAVGVLVAGGLATAGNALSDGALIQLFGGVKRGDFATLEGQVKELLNEGPKVGLGPAGLVAAFDLSTGCPEGWDEFTDAAGRVLIGQGTTTLDPDRSPLTGRKYREHGGSETHKLTEAEMPSHDHRTYFWVDHYAPGGTESALYPSGGEGIESVNVDKTGGGAPHNNMPPFIALYFCKFVGPDNQ